VPASTYEQPQPIAPSGGDNNVYSNYNSQLIDQSGIRPTNGVPSNSYGLPLSQPKKPVLHRVPVPPGLIESIGQAVENEVKQQYKGDMYIPPAVPEPGVPVPDYSDAFSAPQDLSQSFGQSLGTSGPSNLLTAPAANYQLVNFQDFSAPAASFGGSALSSATFNTALGAGDKHVPASSGPDLMLEGSYKQTARTSPTSEGAASQQIITVGKDELAITGKNSLSEILTNYGNSLAASGLGGDILPDNGSSPVPANPATFAIEYPGAKSGDVPHGDLISHGLLQNILAAIEQPVSARTYSESRNHTEVLAGAGLDGAEVQPSINVDVAGVNDLLPMAAGHQPGTTAVEHTTSTSSTQKDADSSKESHSDY